MRTLAAAFIAFWSSIQVTEGAGFTVTDMNMSVGVRSNGTQLSQTVATPTNPFMTTQQRTISNTSSETIYDLSWAEAIGEFEYLFDHTINAATATGLEQSRSNAVLIFTTDIDVILDFEFSYDFSLFGPFSLSYRFEVIGGTVPPPIVHYRFLESAGPAIFEEPSGTFADSGQILLPAGDRYRITCFIQHNADENTGQTGTGSGYLNYRLTAVPEPTTALFIILTTPIALSRKRKP